MQSILPFSDEHKAFQEEFGAFVEKEMVLHYQEWQEAREVSRDIYKKLGDKGWLCMWADPKYGGQGKDFLYAVIEVMETSKRGMSGAAVWLHSDVVAPYINTFGSDEIKDEILPQLVKGDKLICVAMTELEHGSDLSAIETTAIKDGDDYILNGHKAYITNGMISDYAVVAVKTDPEAGSKGISLLLVDLSSEGFRREKMKKIGFHAQDTAELWFDNVRVPAKNLLGVEGKGYGYLMSKLQTERLIAAQLAQGQAERVVEITAAQAKSREMYGTTLYKLQNCQFELADMATETAAGRALVDSATVAYMNGEDITTEVSMAKAYCTETGFKTASRGLQIFGGKGFCYEDSEIGRLFTDLRVQCMSAGTTEVMKLLVARGV